MRQIILSFFSEVYWNLNQIQQKTMLHVILAFKPVPTVGVGQYLQVKNVVVTTFSPAKKVEISLLIRWYSCPNSCFRIIAIDYHVQCNTHTSLLSGKAPLFSACCSWILFCLHESDKMCLCLSNLHRVLRWVWRYFVLLTNNIWHHLLNSAVVFLRFPDTCGYYKSFLKYRISACAQQPPSSGNQILKTCDWGEIFPKCTTSIWYSWSDKRNWEGTRKRKVWKLK